MDEKYDKFALESLSTIISRLRQSNSIEQKINLVQKLASTKTKTAFEELILMIRQSKHSIKKTFLSKIPIHYSAQDSLIALTFFHLQNSKEALHYLERIYSYTTSIEVSNPHPIEKHIFPYAPQSLAYHLEFFISLNHLTEEHIQQIRNIHLNNPFHKAIQHSLQILKQINN